MDLGLPSGSLWLDRPLGAKNIGDPGLMYQWGALSGYQSPTEFEFTQAKYEELGLNLITGSLTAEHDAASVYYGGKARIPSIGDMRELLSNTSISVSENTIRLQSTINGNLISIRATGKFDGDSVVDPNDVFIWSRHSNSESYAGYMHIRQSGNADVNVTLRYSGMLILPVKSS